MPKLSFLLSSPQTTRYLWAVVLALQFLVFAYQALLSPGLTLDSHEYLLCARNFINGLGFQSNVPGQEFLPELVSLRLPGYPLFLLAGGLNLTVVILLQSIIAIGTIWLTIRLLVRFGHASPTTINLALGFFLLTPAHFLYSGMVMSETFFQGLVVLVLFLFLQFTHRNALLNYVLAGLLLAFSVLVKPVVYLAIVPWTLYGIWLGYQRHRFATTCVAFIPLLCLLATFFWNYHRTGVAEISSLQNHNLLHYNMRLALIFSAGPEQADAAMDSLQQIADQIPDYAKRQQFRKNAAMDIFRESPFSYALVHARGSVAFLLDPGRFDWISFFHLPYQPGLLLDAQQNGSMGWLQKIRSIAPLWLVPILVGIFLGNLLKIAAIFSILPELIRKRDPLLWLSMAILAYFIVLTGPIGTSRYALVPLPMIVILSAVGWARLLERRISPTIC